MPRIISIFLALLVAAHRAPAALTFYDVPDYRSVADSPFVDLDEFFLEDFEDGSFDLPNVIAAESYLPVGTDPFGGDIRSVDGDDGVIDGISNSAGILGSLRPIAPFHFFEFTPDEQGRYPTHVGLVVTRELDLRRAVDTFSARSGLGENLPRSQGFFVDDLVAVTNEIGNVEHSRFIGLSWSDGISAFGVSLAVQLDHFQTSYAPVPEPNTAVLVVAGLLGCILRRRR